MLNASRPEKLEFVPLSWIERSLTLALFLLPVRTLAPFLPGTPFQYIFSISLLKYKRLSFNAFWQFFSHQSALQKLFWIIFLIHHVVVISFVTLLVEGVLFSRYWVDCFLLCFIATAVHSIGIMFGWIDNAIRCRIVYTVGLHWYEIRRRCSAKCCRTH